MFRTVSSELGACSAPKRIDFKNGFPPFFPNQRFRKVCGEVQPCEMLLFVCHLYRLSLRWLGHEISYIPGSPFDLHRLASRLRSMAESARDFDALPQRGACAHSPHTTSQRNPRGCSWRRAATVLTGALGPTTTHTGHEGTLIAADSFPTTELGRRGPPWDPCMYFL